MKKEVLFKEVKESVMDFTDKKQLSSNKAAVILGVSPATLSNIKNQRVEQLSKGALLVLHNKLKVTDEPIFNMSNYYSIKSYCDLTRESKRMIGVIGFSGAGKTTALVDYYNQNPQTYMVTCEKSMPPKRFFSAMARALGITANETLFGLIELISVEIMSQESPLLLIDEAGKLSHKILMYLHDLRNRTRNSLGIVMVGVEYFRVNLKNAVKKNREGIPEFYSRVSMWVYMQRPTREQITVICKAHNINVKANPMILKVQDFRALSFIIQNIKLKNEEKKSLSKS